MTNVTQAGGFCVDCGLSLGEWDFCPRCGAKRVELEATSPPAPVALSRTSEMRLAVKRLLDEGRLEEAETLVRSELARERSLETLLTAADVLSRRLVVNEASDLLDDALALAPGHYLVHIRRGEHFSRIGLNPQALEEIVIARRLLPAGDVPALLYTQELDRIFQDRARGGFVRGSSVPRLPFRFTGLKKRNHAPSTKSL